MQFPSLLLRILFLGNMANDGYAVVKELRKMNYDVDLGINRSDFGMALPEWEDAEYKNSINPYNYDHGVKKEWSKPDWIREFDMLNKASRRSYTSRIMPKVKLFGLMKNYDFIETHVPFSVYAQFSFKPYVVYDAGWIRYFPFKKSFRDKLAVRSYKHSKKIIITNPDTFSIFDSLDYMQKKDIVFCPFAIDTEKYKPKECSAFRELVAKEDEILLFAPARQIWAEKGNDKMLKAFSEFHTTHPKSKFAVVSWSVDAERSKEYARQLGIYNDIIWLDAMPKNQLIEWYNAADIILDQFILGSWGTATPEAMSCGKPVLIYYNEKYINRAFSELPPMRSVYSVDDITKMLCMLADDETFRKDIGLKNRGWIRKTHEGRIVALKHIEIIESCQKK